MKRVREVSSKFEDLSPDQQKRYLREHPNSGFFHGSPHSGIADDFSNFSGSVGFFTRDRKVAEHYAKTPTMGGAARKARRREYRLQRSRQPGSYVRYAST